MSKRNQETMNDETLNATMASMLDAGLTLQRELARSALEAMRTSMTVTRASIQLARENVEHLPDVMRVPTTAAPRAIEAFAGAVPGLEPRDMARTASEMSGTLEAWQSAWMQGLDAWRMNTSEALARYEDVLEHAARQSDDGVRAWLATADASAAAARDLTTRFVGTVMSGASATAPRGGAQDSKP